ncbi:MAG: hypothetical protein HOI70_03995 [Opitutae bacterium]|nr:hypothetical protein [Opitutae bacterium]
MRIHSSIICVLILFIVEGCANKPNSSVDVPVDNVARNHTKESTPKKVTAKTEPAFIENGKLASSSIVFDENTTSDLDIISADHPKDKEPPKDVIPLTIEDKSQSIAVEAIEAIPEIDGDSISKEMESTITHSSSLPKDRSKASGDLGLKSFFHSKTGTMDSNKTEAIAILPGDENEDEIEERKITKPDSLPTQINTFENNHSKEINLEVVNRLAPKLSHPVSTLSINSDLTTENAKRIELEPSNKEKVITDDKQNVQAGFFSSNSSLGGENHLDQIQHQIGFRASSQKNESLPLPRNSISFLDESRRDKPKTEISSASKIVSFKNIPLSSENEITDSHSDVAFRANAKPLIRPDNHLNPRIAFTDPITKKSNHPAHTPTPSDIDFNAEKELEYGKLKSFLDRNGAKAERVLSFDKSEFPHARSYLDMVREGEQSSVSSDEKIKRKSRFLKTLKWIENRGRVREDLIPE